MMITADVPDEWDGENAGQCDGELEIPPVTDEEG